MKEYDFKAAYTSGNDDVKITLVLLHFMDENGHHFIYSPHLDLTGYGKTEQASKDSFKIMIDDFIDYTMKKRTLGKVLKKLGWTIKGNIKRPKKVVVPSMSNTMNLDYVGELFDKYNVQSYQQEVGIPVYA